MVQIIIGIVMSIVSVVGLAWLWKEAEWSMGDSAVAARIVTLSALTGLFLAIAVRLFVSATQTGPYEFIRINGEKGIAEHCYTASGSLICETSNNSTVLVREYRKVGVKEGD